MNILVIPNRGRSFNAVKIGIIGLGYVVIPMRI